MEAWAQLITSIATLAGVCFSAWVSLRNSRKIDAVHVSTNGKMDKLLKVTGAAEFAKGVKQEQDSPSRS